MLPRPRSFAGLLDHWDHFGSAIARYQMLCRVANRAERAFVPAMLSVTDTSNALTKLCQGETRV